MSHRWFERLSFEPEHRLVVLDNRNFYLHLLPLVNTVYFLMSWNRLQWAKFPTMTFDEKTELKKKQLMLCKTIYNNYLCDIRMYIYSFVYCTVIYLKFWRVCIIVLSGVKYFNKFTKAFLHFYIYCYICYVSENVAGRAMQTSWAKLCNFLNLITLYVGLFSVYYPLSIWICWQIKSLF